MDITIALVFGLLVLPGPSYTNSDNLARLTGTLKTMQRAACDDQMVSLSCPPETIISVQYAHYQKAMPGGHACMAETVKIIGDSEECLLPTTVQYSLLQTVVEACQKKPQCEFSTKLKAGQLDPCPSSRKFVEVKYKCRPQEFWLRTGCEGDVVKLHCNVTSRIAILAAQFGHGSQDEKTCPQPRGAPKDVCWSQYAVEKVIHLCHGRRSCQILATNETFGSNCRPKVRTNLKVSYACVPNGVLKKGYEIDEEEDKTYSNFNYNRDDSRFEEPDDGEKWREPNAISPSVNTAIQAMNNEDEDTLSNTAKTPLPKYSTNKNFFIYISVGMLVIVIIVAIIILIRCYKMKQRDRNSKNGDMFTTETPNVFDEATSDIDNDLDVSHISGSFYDPVHPDMIIYRDGQTKTALRAMKPLSTVYPCAGASMYGHVDYKPTRITRFADKEEPEIMMSPKSLHGYHNSQFYYG